MAVRPIDLDAHGRVRIDPGRSFAGPDFHDAFRRAAMSELKVVIAGAAGRMGRTLIRTLQETAGVTLAGAVEAKGHPDLGKDASTLAGLASANVTITDDPLPLIAQAEAVI